MAASPPLRVLTVPELARMAHAFDALSDSDAAGARYPAVRFVEFVRDELSAHDLQNYRPAGQPNRLRDGRLREPAAG